MPLRSPFHAAWSKPLTESTCSQHNHICVTPAFLCIQLPKTNDCMCLPHNRVCFFNEYKKHSQASRASDCAFLYAIASMTTPWAMPGTFCPSLKDVLFNNAPVGTNRIRFHSPASILCSKYADSTVAEQPQPLPPA